MKPSFDKIHQQTLLTLARETISYYLDNNKHLPIDLKNYHPFLQEKGACFVTLNQNEQLRGCIGSLKAYRPLITDVTENAIASAFKDYRFNPISREELNSVNIEISVLTPMTPINNTTTEANLLEQLAPGKDGLMITDGIHQATFLPQVWKQLPDKEQFLHHLKLKAGLQQDSWPQSMKCYRYHCIKCSETA